MFAGIDIAARTIWLRNDTFCAPRMDDASRWTFNANECAFRQTLSFLKSLIPKDGGAIGAARAVSPYAAAFYSIGVPRSVPRLSRLARSVERAAGGSVVPN
jgi:hypothetical protein